MTFREQVEPIDYQIVESEGKEFLFPEFEKDFVLDRFSGKSYPCSGMGDFVCALAEEYWEEGHQVLQHISQSPAFKTKKRDAEKTLTIGVYYRNIINGGAQRVTALLSDLFAEQKTKDGETKYNVVLITDEIRPEDENVDIKDYQNEWEELFEEYPELRFDYSRFETANLPEYKVGESVHRAFLPPYKASKESKYRERNQAWTEIIDTYNVDIVISGMWSSNVTLWDMLSVKGHDSHPAFILLNHSFFGEPFQRKDDAALRLAYMYRFCDAVVVLSEMDKQFVNYYTNRAYFIPNPIAEREEGAITSYEEETLLWVGRFSKEKNPVDVLKMVQRVSDKKPNVKLYMIGTGEPELIMEVIEAISLFGLEEQVIVPGFTMNVEKYFEKASVFISTSSFEGFPTTLAEAFSYSVPVVEYEMPWLAFSQDPRGFISVKQGDYDAMANVVCGLLDDPNRLRQIGKEGNEKLSMYRDMDICSLWEGVFRDVFTEKDETYEQNYLISMLTQCHYNGMENLREFLGTKNEKLHERNEELKSKLKRVRMDFRDLRSVNREMSRMKKEIQFLHKFDGVINKMRKVKKKLKK